LSMVGQALMKSPYPFQPGDVAFIMHHNSWISKAFAWFMGSKWSHCFIIWESTEHNTYLLETSDYEVINSTLDKYLNDPYVEMSIYSRHDMSDEDRLYAMQLAQETCLGTTYGYFQLISLAIRALLKKMGIQSVNWIRQGYTCNEVVLTALSSIHSSGLYQVDPKSLDTQDIFAFISIAWSPVFYKAPEAIK